jgi:hypothetical protein
MIILNGKIMGGAKSTGNPIYCGSKPTCPKGKVRGRPSTCYKKGISSGFYAGLLKGRQEGQQAQPAPQAQAQGKTEAQWRGMSQRALQVQAKEWEMKNYGVSKAQLIERFLVEARRRNLVV